MATPPRPDPASPAAVAFASFPTVRKGFDPDEVRTFLHAVAQEMTKLEHTIADLRRELQERPAVAAGQPQVDEETIAALLGEETARIVQTAREAAAQIRTRAEESATKLLRDASEEAARLRSATELETARRRADAAADAEAEVDMARQQGRDMVNEAREYREKVLADTARRRELARAQIEQLVHGRDRLVNAFERARLAAVDVISELAPLGTEPEEFVNLAPTTGPVPMVPNEPRPAPADMVPTGEVPAVPVYDVADEPADDWPDDTEVTGDEAEVVGTDVGEFDEPADDEDQDDADDAAVEDAAVEDADGDDAVDDDAADEDADDADDATDLTDETDSDDEAPHERPRNGLTIVPSPDPIEAPIDDASAPVVSEAAEPDDANDVVVHLPAPDDDDLDDLFDDVDDTDDRPSAPVVSLFAGEIDTPPAEVPEPPVDDLPITEPVPAVSSAPTPPDSKPSVDDLFAKLRRASAAMVAKEAAEALADGAGPVEAAEPAEPVAGAAADATPFNTRDEALVPLIVSAARKLKRVLADEQNDVLDALRRSVTVGHLDTLLPAESDQCDRYLVAIGDDLVAAARAGAASLSTDDDAVDGVAGSQSLLDPVGDVFAADVVRPLRERLDRAVMQMGDDTGELATLVRNVYREWKTQRIDEHVEDLVRLAHGRGAFAVLAPGTSVCWRVDPNGPACADAEDNALGGVIAAGDAFPTGHTHPPMHSGCRCLLETTPG